MKGKNNFWLNNPLKLTTQEILDYITSELLKRVSDYREMLPNLTEDAVRTHAEEDFFRDETTNLLICFGIISGCKLDFNQKTKTIKDTCSLAKYQLKTFIQIHKKAIDATLNKTDDTADGPAKEKAEQNKLDTEEDFIRNHVLIYTMPN